MRIYPCKGSNGRCVASCDHTDVYFVRAADGGPIKIGHATDVAARLRALQSASASPLVLLAVSPGGRQRERELHERFGPDHSHGEWFQPSVDLLGLIEKLRLEST